MKTNKWTVPGHICSWCFYHPWPYHSPGVVGYGLLPHWMLHLWIYLLVQLQSDAYEGTEQTHWFHDQPILPWESLTDLPLPWSLILGKEFGQGWWVPYGRAFGVHQCALHDSLKLDVESVQASKPCHLLGDVRCSRRGQSHFGGDRVLPTVAEQAWRGHTVLMKPSVLLVRIPYLFRSPRCLLTLNIRLQNALSQYIRAAWKCRYGLCFIQGCCCSLHHSIDPQSFINRPWRNEAKHELQLDHGKIGCRTLMQYVYPNLHRSKASMWSQAIKPDPSSPLGYERKHPALLSDRRYDELINACNDMLLKIKQPQPSDLASCRIA